MRSNLRNIVPALVVGLVVCAGCGGQVVAPVVTPSPTIAGAAPRQSPSPAPPGATTAPRPTAPLPATPTFPMPSPSASPSAPLAPTSELVPFTYLWPSYLPPGMQVSPAESRIAQEGEIGVAGLGFFIVTFTSGAQKLVIGGGATESLPLTGDERRIAVGERQATLITSGDQRQIVFDVPQGNLFLYGFGIGEEELLRVAESLAPIDVGELRARVDAG